MLQTDGTISVTAEASTLAEVLRLTASGAFDAIVLDLVFPDGNALDSLAAIREQTPSLPIVIFSNQIESAKRAGELGVLVFVSKDSDVRDLRRGIQSAIEGKKFFSLGATREPDGDAPHQRLSKREREIMLKMIAGSRNKEIAFQLQISEKTVATHRARMFKKLGLENLRDLLLYAVRHGLADWV